MARRPSKKPEQLPPYDANFAYIAGYTEGGAPYGVKWEEQEEIERHAAAAHSETHPCSGARFA